MDNIPTESSPAGTALALAALLAPLIAVLLGASVRPPVFAFFLALLGSAMVIGIGAWHASNVAPGEGTQLGIAVFGGWSGLLSFVTASAIAGGRSLMTRKEDEGPRDPPQSDAEH